MWAISSNCFSWTNLHLNPLMNMRKGFIGAKDDLINLRFARLIHIFKIKKIRKLKVKKNK